MSQDLSPPLKNQPIVHRVRHTLWIAAAAAAVLTLLFYRHLAFTNRILSGVDAFTYFYPYRDYAAKAIRSGSVPLWNPYLFLGAPFAANPQAAVFYPLNLALAWLSGPQIVSWSIILHAMLAAFSTYLYARYAGRLSPPSAFLAASAFAFGGFMSGQTGHINQFSVSAWFPILLLLWTRARQRHWPSLLLLGAAIGVGLLAGHAQSTFISMVGLGVWALLDAFLHPQKQATRTKLPHRLWFVLWRFGVVTLIAVSVAAVQLLPTLELSSHSIRSEGLSYREAVAFSLKPLPRLLWHSFVPPWGRNLAAVFGGDFYTEYLAYIGVIALLLAIVASAVSLARSLRIQSTACHRNMLDRFSLQFTALAALGIFLALGLYNPIYWVLYKVFPGFRLFRVPARWLLLYAFGAAMLSGAGLERLGAWATQRIGKRGVRAGQVVLAFLVAVELIVVAQDLPLAQPTAPEAFSSLRAAPAHILAAQKGEVAPGRTLALSDTAYDPGDLAEIQQILSSTLPAQAIYDYVVCIKRQEILAPNLPLAWNIYAVDGYDGGVLPLHWYTNLQRLLLPADQILVDGRLREGLEAIPPSRLLSILGVQWVITDKVNDVWIDDVFYDLAFEAVLRQEKAGRGATQVESEISPSFAATAVGIVSYLKDNAALPDGVPVAEVQVEGLDGTVQVQNLIAGRDTAEGTYGPGTAHGQARIGRVWGDPPVRYAYVTRLRWPDPVQASRISIRSLSPSGQLVVQGVTLIDERDGSSIPVIVSTEGQYRQVHSGDVKIYQVLDTLPRAYVVHHTTVLDQDDAALAAMLDNEFSPQERAILAQGQTLDEAPVRAPQAQITESAPERVVVEASLDTPGYLVLSDSWYPGWQATVDGTPATVERANFALRAVYVPKGDHVVTFEYRPASFYWGLTLSSIAAAAFAAALAVSIWITGKRCTHRV